MLLLRGCSALSVPVPAGDAIGGPGARSPPRRARADRICSRAEWGTRHIYRQPAGTARCSLRSAWLPTRHSPARPPRLLNTRHLLQNQIFLSRCGQRSPFNRYERCSRWLLWSCSKFGGVVSEPPGQAAPARPELCSCSWESFQRWAVHQPSPGTVHWHAQPSRNKGTQKDSAVPPHVQALEWSLPYFTDAIPQDRGNGY